MGVESSPWKLNHDETSQRLARFRCSCNGCELGLDVNGGRDDVVRLVMRGDGLVIHRIVLCWIEWLLRNGSATMHMGVTIEGAHG